MTRIETFDASSARKAVLHRMVMKDHVCPWGLKSLHLLKSNGYEVEDRHLTTREEIDAFKARHGVATTPQTFINGERVGGYDDLQALLRCASVHVPGETSYVPVIALFSMTALAALALSMSLFGTPLHHPRRRMVHRPVDGGARTVEAAGRREILGDVPELRPAVAALGTLRQPLSVPRRGLQAC